MKIEEDDMTEEIAMQKIQPPQDATTILIIDDEEIVRAALSQGLERDGYIVLQAANGEQGVAICQEHGRQIDLVILDLVLPEQWGDEIFPQLKTLAPGIKVIVYSGYKVQRDEFAGVDAVLGKPRLIGEILAEVRSVLDGKK